MTQHNRPQWNPRQWSLSLLLLAGLLATLGADAPTTQPGKTQRFFWRVASPTTVVYFLGSIHVASQNMYPLPPEIEAAYRQSNLLVEEIDLTKVNQTELAMKLMQDGSYPQGDSLDKHLSPEAMKSLQAFCDQNGFPMAMLATMKPALAGTMMVELLAQNLGLSADLGVDKHFLDAAVASKDKTIIGLESAEDQLKLITGIDDKVGEKFLVESLKESGKEELEKLIKAWNEGDVKTAEAMLLKDENDEPEGKQIMDTMIFKRNDGMLTKIEQLLKGNKPAFVVVGAAHLLGDKGILKKLEAKNYKVERPDLTQPAATTNP